MKTIRTQLTRFGSHIAEPVWKQRRYLLNNQVPGDVACWLFDQGSLTKRVIQACNNTFRVEVISQGWARPMLNEAIRLGMANTETALIREVYLFCGDTPWVYARTVIPRRTLTGEQRFLAHLGNKPLGAVLFADPNMQRDEVEVARITHKQRMFNVATQSLEQKPQSIWGRRSVFYLKKKRLLVNEVFLPAIRKCHW
jgi:chorismate--pyruvate lyase